MKLQVSTPIAQTDSMIGVRELVFEYPGTRALENVSFDIEPASITALVGPNGAGKTTLLRCLAALETPLAGAIRLDGIDVLEDPRSCHRRVGYLSDFYGLYDDLTAQQCLSYAEASRGKPTTKENVERIATQVGLGDYLGVKAGALSRGLRQRLAIAQAIDRLTSDSALRSELTERGAARAQTFTWENSARKLVELYQATGKVPTALEINYER